MNKEIKIANSEVGYLADNLFGTMGLAQTHDAGDHIINVWRKDGKVILSVQGLSDEVSLIYL